MKNNSHEAGKLIRDKVKSLIRANIALKLSKGGAEAS